MRLLILLFVLLSSLLVADESDIAKLAKTLHLSAGSKAIIQWERVFTSARKMKRYKIDKLSPQEREKLKAYLVNHAIDSDQPTIAGA
jgi:hypothetical protein